MTSAADFDRKYKIVDAHPPRHSLMAGHYKQSFAYFTLRERLPVILTGIIDGLTKDKDELAKKYGEECREELKNIIGSISQLKYQLQTNKRFEHFTGNEPDKQLWNEFINELPGNCKTYFSACWLYAECYMYRRVSSFFEASKTMKEYDYFDKQKFNALVVSQEVIETVIRSTRRLERSKAMFKTLLKLNLWGNRCDLSISSGKEVRPNPNAFDMIESLNESLIIDETDHIWDCLSTADDLGRTVVDFVCDNAGYELFTDFILAEYIIEKQLAFKVRFHVKAIPWFISDVTPKDFHATLKYLVEHKTVVLCEFGQKLTHFLKEGRFELAPIEYFWTSPYEYYLMKEINPALFKKLVEARLVIFKGDLNYRKLLGDFTWDNTEPFLTCLRGFQPTNLCTLRTVKADLICGLPEGLSQELDKINPNWMITGEYGVIQFAEGGICPCILNNSVTASK